MKKEYENSLFYQIHSCARRFDILFAQFFKEINLGVSSNEHIIMGIVRETKDCCQRDIAKIMFKDRANMGKIISTMEKKGFIETKLATKNNRPAKILQITEKGDEIFNKGLAVCVSMVNKIYAQIPEKTIEETKRNLQDFSKIVEKTLKTNI